MDILDNEPFLSYLKSQFQSEAKYEVIVTRKASF